MINKIRKFFNKETGQGLVEYGLILALISVLSIGAISTVGETVSDTFFQIGESMEVAPESDFRWVKSTHDGAYITDNEDGRGYYQYIGPETEVVIPREINGHRLTSYHGMFQNTNVHKVSSSNSKITSMSRMFKGSRATELDVSDLNTKGVTDMHRMFQDAKVESLDVSSFMTKKVVNMDLMFSGTIILELDVSNFDTSNVTNFGGMFYNTRMKSLDVSNFKTHRAYEMHNMFNGAKVEILDLSSFDTTNVTRIKNMFLGSSATVGYARTESDANMFNGSEGIASSLVFGVK